MDSVASPTRSLLKTHQHELLTHLILARVPHFGPATYWSVLDQLNVIGKIIEPGFDISHLPLRAETRSSLNGIQRRGESHPLVQQAQRELEWMQENDITLVTYQHEAYPALLKAIAQAPPLVFVKGEINNLILPQIAMVGSRNPSPAGRENAIRFAQQLSAMGFVVTSGLALGIDAASHRGALKNNGPTIAVMGTGIDKIYPHAHKELAQEIVENGGTLVTEFPFGSAPQASHFPRRNRIISGMSLGVLVVEAAVKSGSLITARYALQHDREVFAIPGSIHNPVSRGCHTLLREGAHLIENVEDLREHLTGLLQFKYDELNSLQEKTKSIAVGNTATNDLSADEQNVLEQLDFDITNLDVLSHRTQMNPGALLAVLMELELRGLVEQAGGGYQRLP